MSWLATVVLRHESAEGIHYDWLLDPPPDHPLPAQRLWAARVAYPPHQWLSNQPLILQSLPPHRRIYLEYQGPLAGGHGSVARIASGRYRARLWEPGRMVLDVEIEGFAGHVEVTRLEAECWQARWGGADSPQDAAGGATTG